MLIALSSLKESAVVLELVVAFIPAGLAVAGALVVLLRDLLSK